MVTIRPMQADEEPAVKTLVLNGLRQRFGTLQPDLNPDLDDLQTHYIAKDATILVAADAEKEAIIGCGILIKENGSDEIARIVRMAVRIDCQGYGVGYQLGQALLRLAENNGFTQILVETNHDWHSAIRLYQRLGFTPFKEVEISELGYTEIHMQRSITPPHH